jgi:hypothetical protein
MTTKRICYTRPDGGVSVIIPAPHGRRESESEEEWLARIVAKDVPADATNVHICEASELPDRVRREKWIQRGPRAPEAEP